MCEINRHGTLGMPAQRQIVTGIEECQRSGVFVNGTDQDLEIQTGGVVFMVLAGKAATIPVAQDIYIVGNGNGLISWTVTSAVLPVELVDAPPLKGMGTTPPGVVQTASQKVNGNGASEVVKLSSGNYSKLTFILKQEAPAT